MTFALPMTHRLPNGDDFADSLDPLLVKTLRQSLRGRMFVGVFLWTQFSLALLVGFQALVSESQTRLLFHVWQWVDIFLILAVMIPLWPVFVADEDHKPESMDLIRLTPLSMQKVATSKMMCVLVQAGLLAVSMLPYEILCHYLGMEMLKDLEAFAWLLGNMVVLAPWGVLIGSLSLAVRLALAPILIGGLLFVLGGVIAIVAANVRGMWCPWFGVAPVAWVVGFSLAVARYENSDPRRTPYS